MAARRPFWKWHHWKSIGFCLWPPSTCIWNLKLKFQSKLDLCSGNHVLYRQTDRRTDGRTDGQGESSIPPSNFVGRGYKKMRLFWHPWWWPWKIKGPAHKAEGGHHLRKAPNPHPPLVIKHQTINNCSAEQIYIALDQFQTQIYIHSEQLYRTK